MVAGGASALLAFQVLCIAVTGLAAGLSYAAARTVMEERTALLFAAVYVLNPFRLNELFIRAALGEALAMCFLPLVGVGMWLVIHAEKRDKIRIGALCLVLGYTGLISSHILTSVLAAVFCALFVIMSALAHPRRFFKEAFRLLYLAGAAVLTVLLNAWFLIPFLDFYDWDFYITREGPEALQTEAVAIGQLFAGEKSDFSEATNWRTPEKTLGPAALFGILLFLGMRLADTRRAHESEKYLPDGTPSAAGFLDGKEKLAGGILLILSSAALFMCTELFPWAWLSEHSALFAATLGKIQFPWRLLAIAAPLLSALIVLVLRALMRHRTSISVLLAAFLAVLCTETALQTCSDWYRSDAVYGKFDNVSAYYIDYTLASADYISSAAWLVSGTGPEISISGTAPAETDSYPSAASDTSAAAITDYHANGSEYIFSFVNLSGNELVVTVPVYWYGLHTAYLDMDAAEAENAVGSGDASVSAEEEEGNVILSSSMNDALQFTDIVIPGDVTSGTVSLIYEEPQSWRYAEWISLGTAIVLVLYIAAVAMMRRIKPSKAPASAQ